MNYVDVVVYHVTTGLYIFNNMPQTRGLPVVEFVHEANVSLWYIFDISWQKLI